jgi:NADH-quinone oxidoreductase subunit N
MILCLLPLLVLVLSTAAVMLLTAWRRNHVWTAWATIGGLSLATLTLPLAATATQRSITTLLLVDNYALFFMGLVFVGTMLVAALSFGYLERRNDPPEEFYMLLLTAAFGSAILAAATHFFSFILGLELLSVSLYALIAYPRREKQSAEAGIKYLILAAGSAALLLFGMALLYAELGTMEFAKLAAALEHFRSGDAASFTLRAGLALMIAGFGFKLALVPFHMWTPDVYQGAPAPVTAFVATVGKGAMFAILLRFFTMVDVHALRSVAGLFTVIAVLSMFTGNLLGLLQDNVKRILAYSSIAHLGYLLVAFLDSGKYATTAVAFYLAAYFITTIGAFGVLAALSGPDREVETLADIRGLYWRRPWMAAIMTAMMLSLSGIPLTAGFVGKFFVLAAGEEAREWPAIVALVLSSAIGLVYYLRVIVAMSHSEHGHEEHTETVPEAPLAANTRSAVAALSVVTVALLWLGIFPGAFLRLVEGCVSTLH